jgi:hypothetical protein
VRTQSRVAACLRIGSKPLVAAALCATALTASATAAQAASTPAGGSAQAVPGITLAAGGWIHYTDTFTGAGDLTGAKTLQLTGTHAANGGCDFSNSTPATATGGYEEETAYNPQTCQETVVLGTLTASGKTAYAASIGASPAGAAKPAAGGTWHAFEKVSYVDPLDITITSLTANLSWSSNGSSFTGRSANSVAYEFKYDGWSSAGVKSTWINGNIGASYESWDTFTNTDFEEYLIAAIGPSAIAACGMTTAPAVFFLAPTISGNTNGTYSTSHGNNVSGGCSDLVHFRENHGTGSSS